MKFKEISGRRKRAIWFSSPGICWSSLRYPPQCQKPKQYTQTRQNRISADTSQHQAFRSCPCPRIIWRSKKIMQTRSVPGYPRSSPEWKISSWWWRVCDSSFLTFRCLLSSQWTLGDYRMIGWVCVIVTERVTPFLESMTETRGWNGAGSDERCTWRQPLPPSASAVWEVGRVTGYVSKTQAQFGVRCGTLTFSRSGKVGEGRNPFKSVFQIFLPSHLHYHIKIFTCS